MQRMLIFSPSRTRAKETPKNAGDTSLPLGLKKKKS